MLLPLDEDALRRALVAARAAGIEAVAVAFLHGFRHPAHEIRAAEIARAAGFGEVIASHAAAPLLGRHDFGAFQASSCEAHHAVRELRRLDVIGEGGGRIEVVAEATAFLRHMVRNIVGTLVAAGLGRIPPADVAAILASRDRRRAGATAPPQGLVMVEVKY